MKKTILFSAMFLSLLTFAQKIEPAPGDGKDAHGCSMSAGYTYSQLNKNCVRSFEQKVQLTKIDPKQSYTSGTGVLFSKDLKKAEIFIPDGKESSMILSKEGKKSIWKNGKYVLSQVKKGYELRKNNVVIYK